MKKKLFNNLDSLSIIIPFYNEKKRLNIAFKNIKSFLKKNYISKIELIFVDDGSTDNGNELVNDFFKKLRKKNNLSFKLLKIKKNSGKGYALKKGCLIAKKKMDFDNRFRFFSTVNSNYTLAKKKIYNF